MRIALVEDDPFVAGTLHKWLEAGGHGCRVFPDGRSLMREAARESFDLMLLDWMLPDTTGGALLAWIRENLDWEIPVIFATARGTEEDIVHGLKLGADDYLVKPVRRNELLARIDALQRRSPRLREAPTPLEMPPYRIDAGNRSVSLSGVPVPLTGKEYDLALVLFRNLGRLLSREHLLEAAWGRSGSVSTRTVDTHVSRLRRKLRIDQQPGWRLAAVQSRGYILSRGQVLS